MKKQLILVLAALSISISSQAQALQGWYNYGKEVEVFSMNFNRYSTHVFPDSTVQVEYNTGLGNVWMHGVGQVLDPTSWVFDNGIVYSIDDQTPYYIDSVAFPYYYYRPQTTAGDTLVIQLYKEGNIESFYDDPWDGQPGYDDNSYARLKYDTLSYRGATPFLEITKILTDDDVTFNGQGYMSYHIGELIPAGEVVAATYTYYPGNPYADGDTLDNGFVPTPTNLINDFIGYYFVDADRETELGLYNHGLIATGSARYNDNSNGWGQQYWPGMAASAGIYHVDIDFYLTSTLGISSLDLSSKIKVFPNPCTNFIQVDLSTFKDSDLSISLINNEGRTVEVFKPLANAATFKIDMSQHSKGVYILKIKGATETLRKQIVKG